MSKGQYTLTKLTILPLIFRVLHPQFQQITYLLKQPKTKSLIMFGLSIHSANNFFTQNKSSIQEIEQSSQSTLRYIFFNDNVNKTGDKFVQSQRKQSIITPEIQGDLKPLVIGDHSICFIDAKGYRNPFSLIAVTHLNQTSTKLPVLFPGSLISPCSIDYKSKQIKAMDYLNSLERLKYFPSETYIFPTNTVSEQDLLFAKALIKSSFIEQKIALFTKNKKFGDALIPTTVLQQKMMNPFLISNSFADLLGTKDKQKSFNLLRKMRQQFKI